MIALCAAYVKQRDLEQRFQAYEDGEAAVRDLQVQVEQLEQQVQQGRQRIEDLATDPVEQEAAIRRWSGKLREGEVIYHVEVSPGAEVTLPAPPAGEHGIQTSN
ncbi:MAG: hypothetical protein HYV26_09325 [Candidatus Hydrogenedentes bacterium]|nr:hypothetical protein [Candidatus Hydrogenedentota bacterium]MBI3118952.1 hypothetical protein [Candidatus Hydrogenedentota bacterium]